MLPASKSCPNDGLLNEPLRGSAVIAAQAAQSNRPSIAFQSDTLGIRCLLAAQPAERVVTMRWTSRIAISLVLLTVAGTARAGNEDEVKALFAKFVAAQNAHDLELRACTHR
jgi:hypothetical protein